MHRSGSDRAQFPGIEDRVGENPARFLDADLLQDEDQKELLFARIRGIDKIETIEAFIEVEIALDRPTRKPIIAELNRRQKVLEEIGERPDRLRHGPRRPPSFYADDEDDVQQDEEELSAQDKLARMRAGEGSA